VGGGEEAEPGGGPGVGQRWDPKTPGAGRGTVEHRGPATGVGHPDGGAGLRGGALAVLVLRGDAELVVRPRLEPLHCETGESGPGTLLPGTSTSFALLHDVAINQDRVEMKEVYEYPVIGARPSVVGGFQLSTTAWSSWFSTFGAGLIVHFYVKIYER
jgi:hypothetical protein